MMISTTMPSLDRKARGRRILFQRRARLRTRPLPPLAQPLRIKAHHPGFVIAAASVVFVCILLCSITVAAYVFDPARRAASTMARADGGSAFETHAPRRGAAALLPKIQGRVGE